MKAFFQLVWSDIKRLWSYRIILFILVLTLLFTLAILIFPSIDPSNFIYICIFILPVIVFSISLFIDREEGTLLPFAFSPMRTGTLVASKVLTAIAVQSIPIVFLMGAMAIAGFRFNFMLLFLAYLLGAVLHILIGLSLSIISKTSAVLSLSYVTYIIVFSLSAILYSNGIIPLRYQYYLIISPAFLSGVLVDNIVANVMYSESWLLVLAIALQFAYGALLTFLIVIPYFKQFIVATETKQN